MHFPDELGPDELERVFIYHVAIYAHDHVGKKHRAALQLWADDELIGEKDVLKTGGWLNFPVARRVNNIILRSVHNQGASNGDETVIMVINAF